MNIAFAKIGKSIKFAGKNLSPTGGDNEPSACLAALANNNPDKTFYIIGKSNWKTLSSSEKSEAFPFGNVVDIWEDYKKTGTEADYSYVVDYFKRHKIKIDFGVMMMGQLGTVTIPGKTKRTGDGGDASVLDMTKGYTTPMVWWLNETRTPYVELVNDPRYTSAQSRDFMHKPTVSLGQFDYTYEANPIKSYEDQSRINVKTDSVYAGMETMFCVGRDLPKTETAARKVPLAIVLNEGKPSRYDMLNEWVLSENESVEVYGSWQDERALKDSRFVGSRDIEEIQKIMQNVKYTFIIPIKAGWVTSKYLECVHAGTIPFFHPSYDTQNHLDVPALLRPKTPAKMKQAIDAMEHNDDLRLKVINDLRSRLCKPEYYDGTFLNQTVMSAMIPNFKATDVSKFSKQEVNSLEGFF